ncbi:MAG: hypothetical protein ABL973_06555 [Micropepsaceae bacterium]
MKRWIPVTIVAIAAIGFGAAIVPTGLEQAFMSLRDKQYTQATQDFEARWNSGERSREVANALSELYVREGNPAKASEILTLYVGKHPDDQPALERLAEIFRDDQQRDKFISTLETLWKKSHNTELLRSLEKLYELAGREEDRLNALKTLVASPAAQLNDYETLGSMLTARDPKAAILIYLDAFKKWPGNIGTDTAQAFTALAAEGERGDLIKSHIFAWVRSQTGYNAIEAVAATLVSKHLDALALAATLTSGALAKSDPMATVLAARFEAKALQHASSFARLEKLRLAGNLPPKGDDVYIESAILTQHRDLALAHVEARGAESLPYWLQSWIVSKAHEANDTDFLQALRKKFSQPNSAPQNFLLARVELALGERSLAVTLAEKAEASEHDSSAGIAIASLFADMGDTARANQLLRRYAPDPEHVQIDDLAQATIVAIAVKDAHLALSMSQALREARPEQASEILHARALGLNGHGKQALEILDDIEAWTDAKELAVFEVLKGIGEVRDLQFRLLQRMIAEDATPLQRTNYTFMLNDFAKLDLAVSRDVADQIADDLDQPEIQGASRLSRIELLGKINPRQALPYARDAAENNPDQSAYLLLLIYKRLSMKEEAVAYLTGAIDDVDNEKTRLDFLHEWINLGITKAALPYLRALAANGDRQWFYAYDEALAKLGERDTRIAFLADYSRRTGLDPMFKSQLASEILESGAKEVAIELMREEATNAAPNSHAVEQLLYLWGPRPPSDGVEWIAARARHSPVSERNQWLDRLAQVGALDALIATASDWYVEGDRGVAPKLAAALASQKSRQQLQVLLTKELPLGTDVSSSTILANAAEDVGLSHEASILFERAAANNSKLIAAAGRNAAYAGEQTRAIALLQKAAALPDPEPEAVFLLAEALRNTRNANEAQRLYLISLSQSRKSAGFQNRRIELLSLVRLGRLAEAENLATSSNEPSLRIEYASALLDAGQVRRAASVISRQSAH